MSTLFFCLDSEGTGPLKLTIDSRYSFQLWKPSVGSVVPVGVSLVPHGAWWAIHQVHLLANRDYGIFVAYDGNTLVHYSGVYPGYFRFPFMAKNDLQIGNTWTHPDHRGRNIAAFAIQEILEFERKVGRRFWYLCEHDNVASIRAAEKAGLVCVGTGTRTSRFGLRILGSFVITVLTDSSRVPARFG